MFNNKCKVVMVVWRKKIYSKDGSIRFSDCEDGKTLLDIFADAYLEVGYEDDVEKIDIYKQDRKVATVY